MMRLLILLLVVANAVALYTPVEKTRVKRDYYYYYEFNCGDDPYLCENVFNTDCIHSSWLCDGVRDCYSGEDEGDICGPVSTSPPETTTEPTTVPTPEPCCLAPEIGTCSDMVNRWYYDCNDGLCKRFEYSGCDGNANNYASKDECIMLCGADSCCLDPDKGPCDGTEIMWYFDPRDNTCKQFEYGGCGGNDNKYTSQEKCEISCKAFNKHIICESDRMVVSVAVEWLNELFPFQISGPDTYHLNDNSCIGRGRYIGGNEYYEFAAGLNECGTTSVENATDNRIVYGNSVQSAQGTTIFELECCYETEYTISPLTVIANPCSVMVTLRGFGTFNISGALYTSDLFDTLFDETEFPIMMCGGILVYFGIQVELNDPTLELFTENCYASESDDPNANVVHYNMIVNGCVQGNVTENQAGPLTKLYAWDAYDAVNGGDVGNDEELTLYIHCKVHVCIQSDVGSRCSQGCTDINRKRRSNEMANADSSMSTTAVVTNGPFKKLNSCVN